MEDEGKEEKSQEDLDFEAKIKEYVSQFIAESSDIIARIEPDLLEIEKVGADQEVINRLFRSFHTIKGSAGFLGFEKTVDLCHKTENLISKLRDKTMSPTTEILDVIFASSDRLRHLLDNISKTGQEGEVDISDVIRVIQKIIEDSEIIEHIEIATVPDEKRKDLELEKEKEKEEEEKRRLVEITKYEKPAKLVQDTIRVDVSKIEEILGLSEELVLTRNMITNVVSKIEAKYGRDEDVTRLSEYVTDLDKITSLMRFSSMKIRMVPMRTIFSKFPRVVRDVGKIFNKKVELILEGEETELDRTIVDEIEEPLVHLVRNSVDHGIEPPDERISLGKTPEGFIYLRAFYEGESVVIEIEDDGRGIDPEVMRSKAIQKGFLTEEQAQRLSDRELIFLIFTPGFSSKDNITEVSGRGVGMDVVKDKVMSLKGTLDIDTDVGVGTKVTMKLPLTIGIMNTLRVVNAKREFLIPLSSVVEIVRIPSQSIKVARGQEVMQWRDYMIPIVRLSKAFGEVVEDGSPFFHIVVAGAAEKRIGLLVDSVISSEEVSVKSMSEIVSNVVGIAGATLSGSGEPILIVDVFSIVSALEKGIIV